ncbi:MAG: flavodoxin family protein [Methanospirillaceae archaeon]|nr:flavodoxin family protein [Methanospirillaceae archaeon]
MEGKISVFGILGSPHRHGNTEQLLDRFLSGAESAGAVFEKIILKDLSYSSCRGCNTCHKTGECVLSDDLTCVFERIMDNVDILAIASPIYSMTVTAELKGFIDRAQYIWANRCFRKTMSYSPEHISRHLAFFLSTAGMDIDSVFDAAFPSVQAIINNLGFTYQGNILANALDIHHGIQNHPTALQIAYDTAIEAVRELTARQK